MAGGKGNIKPEDNTNGFQKNPQNINTKGRPVSIRNKLKELLSAEGKLKIPKENIISIEQDGSVIIKLPTEFQLAMKLKQIAMSGKNNNTLKAIQMIMEQIDGKPQQTVFLENNRSLDEVQKSIDELIRKR